MKFKRAAWLLLACLLALASCGVPTDPPETSDSSSPGPDTEMTTITPETNEPPVSVEIDLPGEADKLPAFPTTDLPAVTEGLGGAGLPVMSGEADENAPAIGEISKLTYPDETLAIAGYRLDNVKLILWTEGDLRAVVPLRSDATKTEATIPAEMTRSTTLIWPYDENGVGAPVRINAPEIYWADPGRLYAGQTGQEVRFFGSGLWLEGHTPVVAAVFTDGRTETLEVVDADPYQLRARLSSAPKAGETVRFYLHNGTGGACGWSEAFPMPVAVDTTADEKELTVFRVDDFGAVAGDGQDDLAAFRAAVSAAAKEDGGIIEFGPGEYNLGATWLITNKFTKGLYLRGAGMGDYDKKSGLGHDEYDHIGLSGTYTLLRFADPSSVKSKLIQIGSDNVFVSDMTIIGGDNGDHNSSNVFVGGTNLRFTSVRFIKTDLRDFAGGREISVGSNFEIDNYSSEITVSGCEFHQQGSAINIGNIEGIWPWGFFDSQRTIRNVRITGCDIYGYAGPYTAPDGRSAGDLGEMSRGMIGFNLQGLVFENNTIQGYDKANGKLLVRSIYVNATSEKMYIARNTMKNVGNIPESGFDLNTGEQILIHGNDFTGGIFNVLSDDGTTVTVRTDNIADSAASPYSKSDNTGSRLFAGLDKGDRGYLYVYGGKGVGQSRKVVGYEEKNGTLAFKTDKPFTVPLDDTSIVDLISYSGYNIIYGNTIANPEVILHEGLKTGGVLLFFQGGYNIIAENEFRNLTFGVAINARFKGPTVWNTVRDNTFSGMTELRRDAAQGGDSTYNATFFCVSVVKSSPEGWDDYNVWYAAGNVFRHNVCEKGDYAAELTTNRWNRSPSEWIAYHGEEKGAAMTILENNVFREVKTGVLVGNPDYWSVMRNNTFAFVKKPGYRTQAVYFEQAQTNFCLLIIENGALVADANETLNEGWGQSRSIS